MRLLLSLSLLALLSACGDVTLGQTSTCAVSFTTLPATAQDLTLDSTLMEVVQSFKATATTSFTKVSLRLKANATLTGSLYLLVQTDASNQPSGISVSPSGTLDATKVLSNSSAFYAFTFASSVPVTAATTYWLRLKGSALSAAASVNWIGNGANAYTDGSVRTSSDGTAWTSLVGVSLDMLFNVGC